ncbi:MULTISPECIES: hypothetical protein [Lactococcus]|nr:MULTISPECIES: hypothetical protein [Lactococcus]
MSKIISAFTPGFKKRYVFSLTISNLAKISLCLDAQKAGIVIIE